MEVYFSAYYGVEPTILEEYGAFDICVVSDLPVFIDPFLLFNSPNSEYQDLHASILKYLRFLRDKSGPDLDANLIKAWYRFKEVKQNWLGFTLLGNKGHALGEKFAKALHVSLGDIFSDFGEEKVTAGSHLEKLCLLDRGVGRDGISDFTTNLIKDYLLTYTERFARAHMEPSRCQNFSVQRAYFNYETESWAAKRSRLPAGAGRWRWMRLGVCVSPVEVVSPWFGRDRLID